MKGPGKTNTPDKVIKQKFLETTAKMVELAGGKQLERWYAYNEDPENVCPICAELDALGWVEFGLLPPFKKAHSIIGEGKWHSPDSSCQCAKGYKRVAGTQAKKVIPISGYSGKNPIDNPKLEFEITYSTEEVKEKIKQMKLKFSNCTCKK